MPVFLYGDTETRYLRERDPLLGAAIDRIGPVCREVIPDMFEALVHAIVGQQIATKAQAAIWARLKVRFGILTPDLLLSLEPGALREWGIPLRKEQYIREAAGKIASGELDLQAVERLDDAAFCDELSRLRGVGKWTAEMLLIFCLQRPDVLSRDDLAIQRGLRMLYGRRSFSDREFQRIRRRYSPYGTVASLYLWAVAAGALPELRDPAPPRRKAAAKPPLSQKDRK